MNRGLIGAILFAFCGVYLVLNTEGWLRIAIASAIFYNVYTLFGLKSNIEKMNSLDSTTVAKIKDLVRKNNDIGAEALICQTGISSYDSKEILVEIKKIMR